MLVAALTHTRGTQAPCVHVVGQSYMCVCVCVCVCVWMHLPTHCSGRPVFHLAKGSSDLTPHLVMTHHMEHKDEETLGRKGIKDTMLSKLEEQGAHTFKQQWQTEVSSSDQCLD